jgi:tRNA(adenine34) deaminase
MTNEQKMQLVLKLAEEALQHGELPIASIIFHRDDVIAQGHTSEVRDRRLLVHAELKALLQLDLMNIGFEKRPEMQLFTNLEPCMMCFGATISSFIGEACYSFDAPSDGAAVWASNTWQEHHAKSGFSLPRIIPGVLEEESKELFRRYVEEHKEGPMVDWVRTIL